jgi:hypothetical protein
LWRSRGPRCSDAGGSSKLTRRRVSSASLSLSLLSHVWVSPAKGAQVNIEREISRAPSPCLWRVGKQVPASRQFPSRAHPNGVCHPRLGVIPTPFPPHRRQGAPSQTPYRPWARHGGRPVSSSAATPRRCLGDALKTKVPARLQMISLS